MRIIGLFLVMITCNLIQAQSLDDFKIVDKIKIQGFKVTVYFKDPLKYLLLQDNNFDSRSNLTKKELLVEYLHNNPLYVFEIKKKKIKKTYWLTGNPRKVRTRNYFNLEIRNADGTTEKVIDKINIGGLFFEHMMLFQTSQGKQVIGKGFQIWGYFSMAQSYQPLKQTIIELIKKDLNNSIPEKILAKEEVIIEPLFEYQKCGLNSVKDRNFITTVFQYDSLGKVKNKYPRKEKDTQLYWSSIGNDLTGVTTFPFFSVNDKMEKNGNEIQISSELENIKHYLKDIKITMNLESGQPEKIEGKLIIHGGRSTRDELYIATFSKIGECYLPKIIKFCPLNDSKYERPRILIEIEYTLN